MGDEQDKQIPKPTNMKFCINYTIHLPVLPPFNKG
jgi:hypothetical protein